MYRGIKSKGERDTGLQMKIDLVECIQDPGQSR